MDPFRLLSRSTKLSRDVKGKKVQTTPSSGQTAPPQLFANSNSITPQSRKRKRGQNALRQSNDGAATVESLGFPSLENNAETAREATCGEDDDNMRHKEVNTNGPVLDDAPPYDAIPTLEDRKRVLKQHKLKVTWLNPPRAPKKDRRKTKGSSEKADKARALLFPNPTKIFSSLGSRHGISRRLAENVVNQGFSIATEVQLGALPLLLDDLSPYVLVPVEHTAQHFGDGVDLLTVAPTGSGKTLAYMIPLIHRLQHRKRSEDRHTTAIILAPTKELAGQILNEGRKLAKNIGVTISQIRKGMRLDSGDERDKNETLVKNSVADGTSFTVKSDIVVSTPGVMQNVVLSSGYESLTQVRHLILDEADVLLDQLFREQTLEIWNSLANPALRVSMWSATMGSNIEELAKATIDTRRQRLICKTDIAIVEAPLIRLVVGLKDSAVPNVQHKLIYAATEQGKLMGLRQLLHPATSSADAGPPLRPPFLVFTQTIERAVALHAELLYDIPAEAGGISRIAVLHADLSDSARDSVMTRFRKGEIWVLITTDLLSRGVDFRGINGVVNYDIPTSSAAYVHRVGRTGRAGREGGVAVTLYSKEDIPYLKHVTNIVAMAQRQKGGDTGVQQWLLDAIPNLSKNEKQNLKQRGVESRTARGRENDPQAARKARISTKAGYVRRTENKRKGAILGSQRRAQMEADSDAADEPDFSGFD